MSIFARIRSGAISGYHFFRRLILKFNQDKAFKHGAAISYYTVFSLPAILIVVIASAGVFLGEMTVRAEIQTQVSVLIGPASAQDIISVIDALNQDRNSFWATLLGIGSLLFGATGVFYSLRDSLDSIWEIPSKLDRSGGLIKLLLDRVLSLAMVLSMGFILIVSMLLDTLMVSLKVVIQNLEMRVVELVEQVIPTFGVFVKDIDVIFWGFFAIDTAAGLLILTFVFALIFRYLPSARIRWRDVWVGSFFTAILFSLGKAVMGWYIGHSAIASAYGAAGSVVLLLIWVYYSSNIMLVGAEFIYFWTESRGRGIEPAPFIQLIVDKPLPALWQWIQQRTKRQPHSPKPQPEPSEIEATPSPVASEQPSTEPAAKS